MINQTHSKDMFRSNGFDIQRIRDDTLQVNSTFGVLQISPDFFGSIYSCKEINSIEDPIFQQISHEGKVDELKQGILEFLTNEEEDIDFSGTSTNSPLPIDEIMKKISLNEGMVYSASVQSIFEGSAFDSMKSELRTLKERVQQSVRLYDSNDLEELLKELQEEIYNLGFGLEYSYEELPSQTTEEIDNYVSYFTHAKKEVEEIAECIKSVLLTQ